MFQRLKKGKFSIPKFLYLSVSDVSGDILCIKRTSS